LRTFLRALPESLWLSTIALPDGTIQLLKQLNAPDVSVYFHEINKGKGAALRTGFCHAKGEF